MSDIEAYQFALKFENGAEDYYRQKIAETENANVQRFYRWLIGEEEMHSRLLASCLEFAEDPAAWFQRRSK
jgi:rubrerythrin